MNDKWFILKSFSQFFNYKPARLITLFMITLLLGFNQGFTIVLLIPLLGLLNPADASATNHTLTNFLADFLNTTGISASLEMILAIFTLCLLLVAVLNYYKSVVQTTYQQEFSYHLRQHLFKKIITSDWKFLNNKSKHNHIQILTSEVPKMGTYYYYYLGLATKFIFILAHVAVALMISVPFTLFVVFTGFAVLIIMRKYLNKAEYLGNANIKVFRSMLKRIDDFWQTVKIAKVHNSEEYYFKKFEETNAAMLDYQNKQIRNRSAPQLLFTLAGIAALVVFVYLAYSVVKLPVASLFVLIILFSRIFPLFAGINTDLNMMVSSVASVRMVLNLDREIEEHDFETNKKTSRIKFDQSLNINQISYGYEPEHPLFVNFSESVQAGKITGIIGKSGRGKTTLIDMIAGLIKPDAGNITIDGTELTCEKLPSWRAELGYLPQDAFFVDGTIRENLIWDTAVKPDDGQLIEVLKRVNAWELVSSQVQGLDTSIANYPFHFSGGERQRLALARVLLRNPRLLLLDEATSSLDPENEAQIMECLLHLKNQVTIIFVTHRETLKPYFDKIIDLDKQLFY